jgi:putative ABC transport system permease protein
MHGGTGGGLAARRAVTRWAWRLFRRDVRQHVLILALLTAAVAAAAGLMCAAYNLAPATGRATFGDANHFLRVDDPEASLPTTLDAAESWFGAVDAVGHRAVPVPGRGEPVEYRSQRPDGPFGQPLLELQSGRYPVTGAEVAVTDRVAINLRVPIGATIDLDGTRREVVGVVQNPSDFDDEFVLTPPSELATSDSVTLLVNASPERVDSFRPHGYTNRIVGSRGDVPEDVAAAVITLVVSTLVLLLVALIGAASFMVIAQRRLPQLGMMAAVGASEKHLRLTMLAAGAVTGVVAAVLGTLIGLAGWIALAPHLERVVGHRIDALNVPWLLVLIGMLLAVGAATAAAWWPGRTMSRVPPVLALSGRPPEPGTVHRPAMLAAILTAAGAVCLAAGSRSNDSASLTDLALIAVGLLAIVVGVLLVGPLTIRLLARCGARTPVAARLALRDLSRYQARSGAALAAIALALGLPVAVVATAAAAENNVGPGNLPSNALLVTTADMEGPFIPETGAFTDLQAGVHELAAILPDASFLRLDVAQSDDDVRAEPGINGLPAVSLARRSGDGWTDLSLLYVVSPRLLAGLGLDADDLDSDRDVHTSIRGDLDLLVPGLPRPSGSEGPQRVSSPGGLRKTYTSLPRALITTDRLRARGWHAVPSGRWLMTTAGPATAEALADARVVAAQHGLTIEARETPRSLTGVRLGALTVGMLLALAILAMTVGLIRSESSGELRTLTATGATGSARRTITATTAAGLAGLGAILGIAGAYLALAAGRLSNLTPPPVRDLLVIVVGTPLIAAAGGWLLAGREPPALARRPLA